MSKERGLDPGGRYHVQKINDPEGKHDDCAFFVLDPQHDPHARAALTHYAERVRLDGYEALANDLERWVDDVTPKDGGDDE